MTRVKSVFTRLSTVNTTTLYGRVVGIRRVSGKMEFIDLSDGINVVTLIASGVMFPFFTYNSYVTVDIVFHRISFGGMMLYSITSVHQP
jgi:hypothetical protein